MFLTLGSNFLLLVTLLTVKITLYSKCHFSTHCADCTFVICLLSACGLRELMHMDTEFTRLAFIHLRGYTHRPNKVDVEHFVRQELSDSLG